MRGPSSPPRTPAATRALAARLCIAAALLACALPASASAKTADLTFGLKFGGGGDMWSGPKQTTLHTFNTGETFDVPVFSGLRLGFNYSIGAYAQLRLWDFLGLETGLTLTRRKLIDESTWAYTVLEDSGPRTFRSQSRAEVIWGTIRVPLLGKFTMPIGTYSHYWLGVGVEFEFTTWAQSDFSITGSELQGARASFQRVLAEPRDSNWLIFGTGFTVGANATLRVPIDLRFGWNLSQPERFQERVLFDALPPASYPESETVRTRSSFFVELMVGLGFNVY